MSEKIESSKFTYDRFNLGVKCIIVLFDFFNQNEDEQQDQSQQIEPQLQKTLTKEIKSDILLDDLVCLSIKKQFSYVLNSEND